MKRVLTVILFLSLLFIRDPLFGGNDPKSKTVGLCFTENKGQVSDQNGKPRPDVLFGGTAGEVVFHLRTNGISYQFNRINTWRKVEDSSAKKTNRVPAKTTLFRLDINWLNIRPDFTIKKEKEMAGFNNYYLEHCPQGILNVSSFEEVVYQNIYKGIDLRWYEKNGQLKYDYLVSAGADYKQIQIEINGAENIALDKNGDLVMTTPLGKITEEAPTVFQNSRVLEAKWVIKKNMLSLEINNPDLTTSFIIDPAVISRIWGTYYGSNSSETSNACATDRFNNVYIAGLTSSSSSTLIASTGAFQTSFGGNSDAFVAKFNSAGARLWGTYYGTANLDQAYSCSPDSLGNIYVSGYSETSTTVLATPGSYKPSGGGLLGDAFLVKFNPAGARIWGTYYGGGSYDYGTSCANYRNNSIYLAGYSNSTASISTTGSHQPALTSGYDAFLVKFDSAGTRQWGTYYGGTGNEYTHFSKSDSIGNVYVGGETTSLTTTLIATAGSHQSLHGNTSSGYDAFLVKFNTSGVRQWGTYYGGPGTETGNYAAVDRAGNVYMCGQTNGSTGTTIATPAGTQTFVSGPSNYDFLVKFNSAGVRQWGTYYGAGSSGSSNTCVTDSLNNVYLAGQTPQATTLLTTPSCFQYVFGGGSDAYFAIFSPTGVRQYGTYYGGSSADNASACSVKGNKLYLTGNTQSTPTTTNPIATSGGFQNTYSGSTDGFLVRFDICFIPDPPTDITAPGNQTLCNFATSTLSVSGPGAINWFAGATATTVLGTGASFVVPPSPPGIYTYYAEALTCAPSSSRTAITVTVSPDISVNSGAMCQGQFFPIIPSGASTYTISGGSFMVNPPVTTTYSITGTSQSGCVSNIPVICTVVVNPLPTVTVNSGAICLGQIFTMNLSGAASYLIPGGSPYVSPPVSTNYTIYGTSSQGCTSLPSVASVTVYPLPTIQANSGDICVGQTFTITAIGSPTYFVSGGSPVVSPVVTTSYSVSTTSSEGCSNSSMSTVNVHILPVLSIHSTANPVCIGYSAMLSVVGSATAFAWSNGNSSMQQTVTPMTTTAYTVTGTDYFGCSGTTAYTLGISACVGFETINENESGVAVFPNPNTGNFNVQLNSPGKITIYNALGQEIYTQPCTNYLNQVSIDKFANGIYILKAFVDNKISAFRIVKTE